MYEALGEKLLHIGLPIEIILLSQLPNSDAQYRGTDEVSLMNGEIFFIYHVFLLNAFSLISFGKC